jgi:hypothetical protein
LWTLTSIETLAMAAAASPPLLPPAAVSAGIQVSGAGLAGVDGTYVPSGLTNNIFQAFEQGEFEITYGKLEEYPSSKRGWALFAKSAVRGKVWRWRDVLYQKADGTEGWVAGRAMGKKTTAEKVPPVVTAANPAAPFLKTEELVIGVLSGEARAALGAASFPDAKELADAFVKATVDLTQPGPEATWPTSNNWDKETMIDMLALGSPLSGFSTLVALVAVCHWNYEGYRSDHHGQPEDYTRRTYFACVRDGEGNW